MEGIFEEDVSSLVSEDGNFGVGDVSGDIAAARLGQRFLSSNDSSSNLYSRVMPKAIILIRKFIQIIVLATK